MSVLLSVDNCDFNYLKKITDATSGNLSIQIKKLKEKKYIKVEKTFKNNYPKTKCRVTEKGKNCFEKFFQDLQSYKI
tara:strand:+ start:247 stop:477 length:231 start_codon:yes stop_codon:yes gene_type:complete